MDEFKQSDLNLEILAALWNYLDVGTYREVIKLLRSALSTGEYSCLGCGSVLSPKLLEMASDEKAEPGNIQ